MIRKCQSNNIVVNRCKLTKVFRSSKAKGVQPEIAYWSKDTVDKKGSSTHHFDINKVKPKKKREKPALKKTTMHQN
jgi:hypothetical protein